MATTRARSGGARRYLDVESGRVGRVTDVEVTPMGEANVVRIAAVRDGFAWKQGEARVRRSVPVPCRLKAAAWRDVLAAIGLVPV